MRAAQAGLPAQVLFLDLDLPAARTWKNSQPRLDDATVTRLRGLADPAAAAAVALTRATGMRPDQLGALRCCDVSDGHAGLQVRTRGVTYRLPARAAGPVRADVLDRPRSQPKMTPSIKQKPKKSKQGRAWSR